MIENALRVCVGCACGAINGPAFGQLTGCKLKSEEKNGRGAKLFVHDRTAPSDTMDFAGSVRPGMTASAAAQGDDDATESASQRANG